MVILGWVVLTVLFVAELAAMAAFGVWGWQQEPRWLLVWVLPVAAAVAWYFFAAPRAPYGGHGVRPAVKVGVFGLAVLALHGAGHTGWAVVLGVTAVVVHLLALLPGIRALTSAPAAPPSKR
ncbi:hypothetical protein GCM10023169_37280 [Georgenia halophila]|uniref:DUF2568 domain-containing protein n=1 Tax=Georgenia halophila TaxID=620889 RepID=A0ABP8LMA3_9MICO